MKQRQFKDVGEYRCDLLLCSRLSLVSNLSHLYHVEVTKCSGRERKTILRAPGHHQKKKYYACRFYNK